MVSITLHSLLRLLVLLLYPSAVISCGNVGNGVVRSPTRKAIADGLTHGITADELNSLAKKALDNHFKSDGNEYDSNNGFLASKPTEIRPPAPPEPSPSPSTPTVSPLALFSPPETSPPTIQRTGSPKLTSPTPLLSSIATLPPTTIVTRTTMNVSEEPERLTYSQTLPTTVLTSTVTQAIVTSPPSVDVETTQKENHCAEPFNKAPDRSISFFSPLYRKSVDAKVESPKMCSFLCLQRVGACHAFAYDRVKTLCKVYGTGITKSDVGIALGVDFYYLKQKCASQGALLSVKLGGDEEHVYAKPISGPLLIEPMDSMVLERTPGFQQLGFGLVYEPYPENQCIQFCRTNSTPTGMFRHCLAADHNPTHSRCFLMTEDREKTGSLEKSPELYPSPEFVHFRKLFLTKRVADSCNNGYITGFPGRALIGYDQEVFTANSYGICIQRCFQLAQNSLCKSGSYYPKANDSNCILAFEDHDSKPKSLVEVSADELVVQYFSIRSCIRATPDSDERFLHARRFF